MGGRHGRPVGVAAVRKLYLDCESYCEIDIKKVGAWVYTRHPSCRVLMVTYAIDDGPDTLVDMTKEDLPDEFVDAFNDPDTLKIAHNSQFDRWLLQHTVGLRVPIEQWRCTMAKAFATGLPGDLETLGRVLDLPESKQKLADGKALIRLFCQPQTPKLRKRKKESVAEFEQRKAEATLIATPETHPAEWARFCEYGLQDTATLRIIDRRIPDWNYRGGEVDLWHLDQKMNERGLPVDLALSAAAAGVCQQAQDILGRELKTITGDDSLTPTRIDAIRDTLRALGVPMDSLTKAAINDALADPEVEGLPRRVLEIRQSAGRTSVSKFAAFERSTDKADSRIRGGFQYCGAMRTGRWAGRLVQPQNFPRPNIKNTDNLAEAILDGWADALYDDLVEVGVSSLRAVISAPPHHKLIAGDYSNIEGRKLAWLAGEEWKLQAFRDFDKGVGFDIYKLAYARAFGIAPEAVDDVMRQIGKVMELALGFQGAVGAFKSMAANYNLVLPPDDVIVGWVKAWRRAHPNIVSWWYELEGAATDALRNPGKAYAARRVQFKVVNRWLLCRLPSGRFLCYYKARLTSEGIKYEGKDPYTGKWKLLDIYGGKFAENITQASARDVMAYNMPLAEADGYALVATIHDECVADVPLDFGSASDFERAMGHIPPWCRELPLSVNAWEGKRFRK